MIPVCRAATWPSTEVRPSVSCWVLIFSVLLPSIHVLGLEVAVLGASSPGTTMATAPTPYPPRHQHLRHPHHPPHPSTPNPSAAAVFMAAAAVAVASSPCNHHPQHPPHHAQVSQSQNNAPLCTPESVAHPAQNTVMTTAFEAMTSTQPSRLRGIGAQPEPKQGPLKSLGSLVTEYAIEVHFEHTTTSLSFQESSVPKDFREHRPRRHHHRQYHHRNQQQQQSDEPAQAGLEVQTSNNPGIQRHYDRQHSGIPYQSSPKTMLDTQTETQQARHRTGTNNGLKALGTKPSPLSSIRSRRTHKHKASEKTMSSKKENKTRPEDQVDPISPSAMSHSGLAEGDRTVGNEDDKGVQHQSSSKAFEFPSTPAKGINSNNQNLLDRSELPASSSHNDVDNFELHYRQRRASTTDHDISHDLPGSTLNEEQSRIAANGDLEQLQHISYAMHVVDTSLLYDGELDDVLVFNDLWIGDDDYAFGDEESDNDLDSNISPWPARMGVDEDHFTPGYGLPSTTRTTTQTKTTTTTVWQGRLTGPMRVQGTPNDISNDVITGSLIQLPLRNSSPTSLPSSWIALAPCTATDKDIQPAVDHAALTLLFYSSPDDHHKHSLSCAGPDLHVLIPKGKAASTDGANAPPSRGKISTVLPVLTLDYASASSLLEILEQTTSDQLITATISLASGQSIEKNKFIESIGTVIKGADANKNPSLHSNIPLSPPSSPPLASDSKQSSSQSLSGQQQKHDQHWQQYHQDDADILRSVVGMFSAGAKRVRQIWVDFGLENSQNIGRRQHSKSSSNNDISSSKNARSRNKQTSESTGHAGEEEFLDDIIEDDIFDNDDYNDGINDEEAKQTATSGRSMFSTIFHPCTNNLWWHNQPSAPDQDLTRINDRSNGRRRIPSLGVDGEATENEEDQESVNGRSFAKKNVRRRLPLQDHESNHEGSAVIHRRGRTKSHRLVQRVHPGGSGIGAHGLAARQYLQEALMLKENSISGKLVMVLMSTVCGVGVGMFGALLFVVALKVRLFRSRRSSQSGNNSNGNQHQQQQRQQGGGGIGLNLLQGNHHHDMAHSGGVYKKVVPRCVLESFGVQTVLEISPTYTKTSAIVKKDLSFFKKGTLTYAEDVLEMEEGFEEIADRDLARRERRRTLSRALLVGGSGGGGTSSTSNDNDRGDIRASDDDRLFRPQQQPQSQDRTTAEMAGTSEQHGNESDDQVVPDGDSSSMDQITATILNATRRGSYRRIPHTRQGGTNHRGPGAEPETMSASSSVSLSISLESTSASSLSRTTRATSGSTSPSESSLSTSSASTPLSTIAESATSSTNAGSNNTGGKSCNDSNRCGLAGKKGDLPFANANAQTMCAICLAEYEVGEHVRTLPCYHQFHQMCIDPWLLQIASLCPICKRDLWPGPQT
ncbi:hypothetical protein BGW42_004994 [Actinomortierella wolfii]|nr:hypothetical protein BGW42_004994 [Actinomortierella wolfii]